MICKSRNDQRERNETPTRWQLLGHPPLPTKDTSFSFHLFDNTANITSGYCVAALVEEPADARVGIVCGRTLECAGGGSLLDDLCVLPEFAFKLAI